MGLDPAYFNEGLMKPWRGFTPIEGKEKPGVSENWELVFNSIFFYFVI
jgi:hypothetical protein